MHWKTWLSSSPPFMIPYQVKAVIYVHYLCRASDTYPHQLTLSLHTEGPAATLHGALLGNFAEQIEIQLLRGQKLAAGWQRGQCVPSQDTRTIATLWDSPGCRSFLGKRVQWEERCRGCIEAVRQKEFPFHGIPRELKSLQKMGAINSERSTVRRVERAECKQYICSRNVHRVMTNWGQVAAVCDIVGKNIFLSLSIHMLLFDLSCSSPKSLFALLTL